MSYKFEETPVNHTKQANEHNSLIMWGLAIGTLFTIFIGTLRWLRDLPSKSEESVSKVPNEGEPLISSNKAQAINGRDIDQRSPSIQKGEIMKSPSDEKQSARGTPLSTDMQHDPNQSNTRFTSATKYIVGIGIFLTFLIILFISRNVLSLLIIATLIAFIIQPLISFFQNKFKVSRGISVGLTYLVVSIVLLTIPLFIIPATVNAVNFALEVDYNQILINITNWMEGTTASIKDTPILGNILGPTLDSMLQAAQGLSGVKNPEAIQYDTSLENIGARVAQTLGLLVNILGPLVSAIFSFVFMLLISVHLSLSGYKLKEWYPRLIPEPFKPEISQLVNNIEMIWASFLRSQLVLMMVIGITVWLGNWALGTPQAFVLGLIAGLLEIIPNLGPLLATIPAVILALFFGSEHFAINQWLFALLVIGFYVLVQALENQVLVPKILGDAVDLPPVVVIIGVVIAGAAAGILGVFLSTPIIATGREVLGYLYDKILEPPVLEVPPQEKPSLRESIQTWLRSIRLPTVRKE